MIKHGKTVLKFGENLESKFGFLMGLKLLPVETQEGQVREKKSNVNLMHKMLGHSSGDKTKATAKMLGLSISGKLEQCDDCARAKAKQKKIGKEQERAKEKGERLYLDLSTVKGKSLGGKRNWILLVDDHTRYKWSLFTKAKSDLTSVVCDLLKDLKEKHNVRFKKVRCDNAGENKVLERDLVKIGLSAEFEYTSPGTPQQNGVVEREFATLYGRTKAMLNWSKVDKSLRMKLWAECAHTATKLGNLLVNKESEKCAHEMFFGAVPD